MTPAQLAHARANAYHLLSQLLLHGVTPALLPQVMAVAELAQRQSTPFDPDQAAADHQSLFGFNLFPYESVFRHPSGLLGGPLTAAAAQTYHQHAFTPPAAAAADHVGVELAFLAFLCGGEANAWRANQQPNGVAAWQSHQRRFLQTRLLPWLPPLSVALRQQPHPFYQAVGEMLLELAADHAHALGIEDAPAAVDSLEPAPSRPLLLEDDQTSLRDIARFLLTPPHSGVWLSREDVARLARQQQLPRGFGERQQMLLNALRSAAQYDVLPAFIAALRDHWREWQAAYQDLTAACPPLAPFVAFWQQQCAHAGTLLTQITVRIELQPR